MGTPFHNALAATAGDASPVPKLSSSKAHDRFETDNRSGGQKGTNTPILLTIIRSLDPYPRQQSRNSLGYALPGAGRGNSR